MIVRRFLVSGDLTGTITDPTGAVVSGATVTAKNNATGCCLNLTRVSDQV